MRIISSIIIPVFNQWEMTRNCLVSLKETLPPDQCEIIVVDNGSGDSTEKACPALGKELFGNDFHYLRCPENLNFGPASNLGAKAARGEFLIFLNNDTRALPGWYQGLLQDFIDYPDIAATGPVLLYPSEGVLGDQVQCLGVFVSPSLNVGHLYEGISADSPLAGKRRFFQIITAACMMMKKDLFFEFNGFDEKFINGFEDADLCLRLAAAGWRMTINPGSRMYHLTSQTPGRHTHERKNIEYLLEKNRDCMTPDWHLHARADGLSLKITGWMSQHVEGKLAPDPPENAGVEELVAHLRVSPFNRDAIRNLARLLDERGEYAAAVQVLQGTLLKHQATPENYLLLLEAARKAGDDETAALALDVMIEFCDGFERLLHAWEEAEAWYAQIGVLDFVRSFILLRREADLFYEREYLPILRRLREETAASNGSSLNSLEYTLWRELEDKPARREKSLRPLPPGAAGIGISIIMPVYNPEPEHLLEAVASLKAQTHEKWELCVADDASTDARIRPLLEILAAADTRIKVVYRRENGHISAASNSALELAGYDYCALMDQDDCLAEDALALVAEAIAENPGCLLVYSDEDKVDDKRRYHQPYFKPDWDDRLLLQQNYINHLGVYRTDRLREINGFRPGYEGSQDYDMLLRFISGQPRSGFIHIPKVLYHWRVHAGSTAAGIGAKPYAVERSVRAVSEHLAARGIPATVLPLKSAQFWEIQYNPAGEKLPLVSLIVDAGQEGPFLAAHLQSLLRNTDYYKLEILVLTPDVLTVQQEHEFQRLCQGIKGLRLLPVEASMPEAERLNRAALAARGKILGFISPPLQPLGRDWLRTVTAPLVHCAVAATGAKLARKDGTVENAGYASDGKALFAIWQGTPRLSVESFYVNHLPRKVPAVDPRCLFTTKEHFEKMNGLDADLGLAALMDYCLRLTKLGETVSLEPDATLFLTAAQGLPPWEDAQGVSHPLLLSKWEGKLPRHHPHLCRKGHNWTLDFEKNRA